MLDAFYDTYSQLVAFYLAARLFMGSYCLFLSFAVPMVRGMMAVQAILTLLPSAVWIASIHIAMPRRFAAIWIAIFLDFCSPMIVILAIPRSKEPR